MSEGTECFMVALVNERKEPPRNEKEFPGHTYFDVERVDTREVLVHDVGWFYESGERAMPVGAMWWRSITTLPAESGGRYFFAGEHLVVMTPGGTWTIDGRASNCAEPEDSVHRCWPRRGRPPKVTVDKSFGPTCAAGAGSIQVGAYHGFLRDGVLSDG
jgi:hypothetical protein